MRLKAVRLGAAAALMILGAADSQAYILDAIMNTRKNNIRIGPVRLHPHYSITGIYDDNIYKVRRDKENGERHGCNLGNASSCSGGFLGSWIVSNEVGLGMILPCGNHRFTLGYDTRFDNYKVQPKANDSITQGIKSRWSYKGARISASVWNNYLNTEDPPYNPNAPVNGELVARETRWENTVGASLEYALGKKFFVEVHGSVVRNKYLNNTLASLIDNSETKFGTKAGYRIFPKTRIYFGFDRGLLHYSAGRDSNHKDWYGLFGVEGKLTGKLTGLVENGLRTSDYDREDLNATTRNLRRNPYIWVSKIRLDYKATTRTQVGLLMNSRVNEATGSGNFYISRGASVDISHTVRRLTLNAKGGFRIDKYSERAVTELVVGEEKQRRDDSYLAGVGGEYLMREWLTFSFGFEHSRRHSLFSRQFNYQANKTSIGLRAAF